MGYFYPQPIRGVLRIFHITPAKEKSVRKKIERRNLKGESKLPDISSENHHRSAFSIKTYTLKFLLEEKEDSCC